MKTITKLTVHDHFLNLQVSELNLKIQIKNMEIVIREHLRKCSGWWLAFKGQNHPHHSCTCRLPINSLNCTKQIKKESAVKVRWKWMWNRQKKENHTHIPSKPVCNIKYQIISSISVPRRIAVRSSYSSSFLTC